MTFRGGVRAATFALFATAAGVAVPAALDAQDVSCDRGDLEVRALEFRGNSAFGRGDLALRVITTPSSRARRYLRLPGTDKRCLHRDELARDILRLKGYYHDRGYYSTRVDTLVQPMGRSAVRVVFTIDEGQPLRLASYDVTGLKGVADSARIMNRLELHVGDPFDITVFRADMDTIVQRLRDAGYYRAEVLHAYETRLDSLLARASINVIPGKVARFGPFDYAATNVDGGPPRIDTSVVRRIMRLSPGDVYSDRAIVDAQRNLYQLGAYRHIEVAPLPDSQQTSGDTIVKLGVRLAEDYMRQLDSELGWATLDCLRIRSQYTDKNLLGTARRLELNGQLSRIGFGRPLETPDTRQICTLYNSSVLRGDTLFQNPLHYFIGATVRQPRLLGTAWVPSLSVYSERRGEYKAYLRSTQIGADLSATRSIGGMPLRVGYSFEYGSTQADPPALCALFSRCDPESVHRLKNALPLGVASVSLARLRTDNIISPTTGYNARTELRSSASSMLGTNDTLFFNKGTGDIAWYQALPFRAVLALRLRGGMVVGRSLKLTDSVFVPPQERLYAGGATSVRGYQQNELGRQVYIARRNTETRKVVDSTLVEPVNGLDSLWNFHVSAHPDSIQPPERSVPLGGNALVVANVEYRIRDPFFFPDQLQYTFFLDGGDVSPSGRLHALRWTPGIGLRALTPVGPVQVNIGYNPHRRPDGAIYYNPNVNALACATPGNQVRYRHNRQKGVLEAASDSEPPCREEFSPPSRQRFFQRLTFTFSIGPDF